MSRETPQAVFAHARDAMRRGDLQELFRCLDVKDLGRIAENAVALSLGARIDEADDALRGICRDHGFPLDELLRARRGVMTSPGLEATMTPRYAGRGGLASVRLTRATTLNAAAARNATV